MDKYFRECFRIPSRRIYLDSESANIITNRGDCIFQLNNTILLPDDVVCYVQLNEMVMPNTGYNVDESNNTLNFIDTDNTEYNVVIAKGNYNANTLCSALNASFAGTSADYIECSYNITDNTFTFTSTDSSLSYFTFYGSSTIMKVLGFEINKGDVDSENQSQSVLTSTRQIDLSGNNSFYFTTNLQTDNVLFFNTVSVSNYVSTVTNQQTQGNVLAKIQFTAIPGSVQFFKQKKEFKHRIADKYISQIHVKLYDENYDPMIPQQQWNATLNLVFYEVYEKQGIQNPRNYMLEHRFGEK